MSGRAQYRVASAEGRRTFERSMAVKLSDGERRVLECVVALTALYSKLEDEIAVSQIMALTGLSKSTVLRSLHGLKRHGLIVHEPPPPHSGSKAVSRIGLVSSSTTPIEPEKMVSSRATPIDDENGVIDDSGLVSSSEPIGVIDDERMVSSPRSNSSHREVGSTEKSSTEKEDQSRCADPSAADKTKKRSSDPLWVGVRRVLVALRYVSHYSSTVAFASMLFRTER